MSHLVRGPTMGRKREPFRSKVRNGLESGHSAWQGRRMTRAAEIEAHYARNWGSSGVRCFFNRGPAPELPTDFAVFKYAPRDNRKMWTFATRCMAQAGDRDPVELHCFSATDAAPFVEMLYAIAHFHRTGGALGLGHTVNIGRGWWEGSPLEYGLISLPYLDGPALEYMEGGSPRFLWLVPLWRREVEFKRAMGLEALEVALERNRFGHLSPCDM
jgi:hypothetical protein